MSYQQARPRFDGQKPKLKQGLLRVPVTFYQQNLAEGVHGRARAYEELYATYAQVYNPSLKDIEIGRGLETRASLTIRIRDPLGSFQPHNDHVVVVADRRFEGYWSIIDIRPDFEQQEMITIVLGGLADGR